MKKFHLYIGVIMFIPFITWAITGVFFFIKPGYKEAYERLSIKTYAITQVIQIHSDKKWLEVRQIQSILGHHLIVKGESDWQQIDPKTSQPKDLPSHFEVRQLVNDAIQLNPTRYGQIESIDGLKVITNTGVNINLNWAQMSLYQSGTHTQMIKNMYKVHYLQWTGIKSIDKILGMVGLGLVVILASLGLFILFKGKKSLLNNKSLN